VGGLSSAGLPVREKFTGKEFDEEGQDSVNGVSGIQCYYFGARYFDPEVGVWGSCDPVEQFYNAYLYASCNPISHIDTDGRLDIISHYILGGFKEAAGDFWRVENPLVKWGWLNNPNKENLARRIHNFKSTEDVERFFSEHDPSEFGLSPSDWEGFRRHARRDALHETGCSTQEPNSFIEFIIYETTKKSGKAPNNVETSRELAKYQDAIGGILLIAPLTLPFAPTLTTTLVADYFMGITMRHISGAVDQINREGFRTAVGQAARSEVKQTAIEAAVLPVISPMAAPMPFLSTLITLGSIFSHVRHWFLQD